MHTSYQIIIAEDEKVVASLLARLILRSYPTAVVQICGDGQEALEAYDRYGADLLLVNYRMPRMDGLTLIRTLRVRGDTVPMIGMSGDPSCRSAYMAAGAVAFMSGADMLGELARLLWRFLPPLPGISPHTLSAKPCDMLREETPGLKVITDRLIEHKM